MTKAALSNRQRAAKRKTAPKPSRHPKADGATVTSPRMVREAVDIPMERDGMEWLVTRKRLSPSQTREARAYRRAFRDAVGVGATIRSCLDIREGRGSGMAPEGPTGQVVHNLDAQRALFVKRFVVLQGQADLVEVLDGVCGRGLTLAQVAGKPGPATMVLEKLLKVALDMLASHRSARA